MLGFLKLVSTLLMFGLVAWASPAAAQNAPPIKIGLGEALTGGLAAGGKAALLTYQIWADEVNARGGLLGRKVEIVSYDDQSNPATVPGIYTKLLDIDKVDLVMSGYATVPTAAAMPVIIQRKKLFLSLFALAANDKFRYDRSPRATSSWRPRSIRSRRRWRWSAPTPSSPCSRSKARARTPRRRASRSSTTASIRPTRSTSSPSSAPSRRRIPISCSSRPIRPIPPG
jgi:hypothetical protein